MHKNKIYIKDLSKLFWNKRWRVLCTLLESFPQEPLPRILSLSLAQIASSFLLFFYCFFYCFFIVFLLFFIASFVFSLSLSLAQITSSFFYCFDCFWLFLLLWLFFIVFIAFIVFLLSLSLAQIASSFTLSSNRTPCRYLSSNKLINLICRIENDPFGKFPKLRYVDDYYFWYLYDLSATAAQTTSSCSFESCCNISTAALFFPTTVPQPIFDHFFSSGAISIVSV